MIQAVIIRLFDTVARITYAAITHNGDSSRIAHEINLNHIFVKYDPTKDYVLKNICIHFAKDEFVFIAGMNGAGKTTLLRLLAGYIPRIEGEYAGSISFGNENADDLSLAEYSKFVRYVPSDASLAVIGLTVGQEIMTITNTESEARIWLKRMGIDQLWSRETVKLSGGEQVRLVLACALAAKTSAILLDSPLEQLDNVGRTQFLSALKEIALVKGLTVIMTDPNFDLFRPFVTRFLLIENQNIAADVPASEISPALLHRGGIAEPLQKTVPIGEMSGPPLAELRDVRLALEGVQILKGVDFAIHKGEFVALIGENGSGKTTAMLALAGLLKINKGYSFALCPVRYVFQDAFLQMVGIDCEEEINVGPQFYRWSSDASKNFVSKELQWVGVDAKEQPVELHPGKARLISVAAMNFDEAVLILDEPTIGLDNTGLEKIIDLIYSLISKGLAVIAITHDVRLAKCASRIVEMKEGKIITELTGQVWLVGNKAKGLSTCD